mmetsp:Transcript_15979/g.39404  ORF Transcript_15979/g.39404 Transcript_15979/m.39404 type:complete len:147 (-) Transcript_15979:161-601(-)
MIHTSRDFRTGWHSKSCRGSRIGTRSKGEKRGKTPSVIRKVEEKKLDGTAGKDLAAVGTGTGLTDARIRRAKGGGTGTTIRNRGIEDDVSVPGLGNGAGTAGIVETEIVIGTGTGIGIAAAIDLVRRTGDDVEATAGSAIDSTTSF